MSIFHITKLDAVVLLDGTLSFECNLKADKKIVAFVANTVSSGNGLFYQWKTLKGQKQFEDLITDEEVYKLVTQEFLRQAPRSDLDKSFQKRHAYEEIIREREVIQKVSDEILVALGSDWRKHGAEIKKFHSNEANYYVYCQMANSWMQFGCDYINVCVVRNEDIKEPARRDLPSEHKIFPLEIEVVDTTPIIDWIKAAGERLSQFN